MRVVRCDYCGKFIEEGKKFYDDKRTCGIYCSISCCVKEKFNYGSHILSELEVENYYAKWEESED